MDDELVTINNLEFKDKRKRIVCFPKTKKVITPKEEKESEEAVRIQRDAQVDASIVRIMKGRKTLVI